MSIPIIDLHCDLLAYLQENPEKHSPLDSASNCSIPLLEKGNVHLQTLAIWSETSPGSYVRYQQQREAYYRMLNNFSNRVASIANYDPKKKRVYFVLALENVSCLLEEDESFELFLIRLNDLNDPLFYVSLTWNQENRFGGGSFSKVGLKREGELVLEILAEKGIAIDLSHASDALADNILNYIHKKGLNLQPIASHSNFRSVLNCPRNLSDVIAKEIAEMEGLIGINFIRFFVGESDEDFLKHIQYGFDIIGEDHLSLGGDIFGGIKIMDTLPYYLKFNNSACYPEFIELLAQKLSSIQIKKIAYLNAEKLFSRLGLIINQEVKNETLTP